MKIESVTFFAHHERLWVLTFLIFLLVSICGLDRLFDVELSFEVGLELRIHVFLELSRNINRKFVDIEL